MAVKISELSASAQITSDDFLPIVDSGSLTTKRASAQQVLDYVTGSTFNSLTVTTLTGSTVTGSTALFTSVTASYSGSGAGLTDIPNSSLLNDSITVGSTGISLGGSTTTIQGLSVLTGSTVTGSTALFDNITASVALFTGDIRVLGTASIGQLNTVTQQSLIIGDKYITILSGGVDHTGINGAGFLWGTSSGPGETTGALGEHAHVLYDASRDALEIFPGLYVTGSTTVFGISGTTAQFTTLTGSTVTGTLAQFTTVSASTVQISGNLVIYGSASFSENPDYAYVLYTASLDKIVVYPGLYVSGNLTGSGLGAFQTVSASSYLGLPTSSGGTPGGTNTTIQFNSGSTFSGSTRFSWDYVGNTFFVSGNTNITGTLNVTTTSGGSQSTTAISSIVTSSTTGSQDYAIEGNITGASAVTYTNAGISGVNSVTQTFTGTPILANGGGPIGTRGVAIGVNNTGQQTGFSFKGNTGVLGFAANSVVNIGVGGASSLLKNDATNIGVAGTAQNAGGGTAQRIGGLFSISLSSPFSFDPQYNASAALIADNINTSDPIFLARDNSSNVFTIADGGYVVSKNTTNSVTAFQVQNDIGTSLFNVDTFNQRIGIIKANPNATLDVNGNTIISGNLTVTGTISASTYLGLPTSSGGTPGGTNTTIQFNSGSTFSGSTNLVYNFITNTLSGTTAEFTITTASYGLIQGDLRVLGTASIGQLNTITQQSLLIGDKYITILSGGVDHTGINGSGFLWGTSSGPGETTGALGEHAHVLYDASRDALEIFPGLYVSGNASVSGNLVVTGSITELSTRKIKTNIQTVNNQLKTISKLNPVSYVRLDDGRKEYGFISEEVKEVYPEFVVGEGINYPKMVSILVSAVKELTDKVEKQQNEIQILKGKL